MLVVVGINENNQKQVIGLQSRDKGFAYNWWETFKDLKRRRCQVYMACNVLAKVPQKLKQEVAGDISSIFYASSRQKTLELATQFPEHRQKEVPSAVKCLQNSLDSCLTFFDFPKKNGSLRTTNVLSG